jgi:hypothetical protein
MNVEENCKDKAQNEFECFKTTDTRFHKFISWSLFPYCGIH